MRSPPLIVRQPMLVRTRFTLCQIRQRLVQDDIVDEIIIRHSHKHQQQRQLRWQQQQQLPRPRCLVTSSVPPSEHANIERPETIVLAESTLYTTSSWREEASSFFPMRGMQFASIDFFHDSREGTAGQRGRHVRTEKNHEQVMQTIPQQAAEKFGDSSISLEGLEETLANDLSYIGSHSTDSINNNTSSYHSSPLLSSASARVVLIARGPIQCLVAQYYLESNPLAGLVLVDPIVLPQNGRDRVMKRDEEGGGSDINERWEASLSNNDAWSVLFQNNVTELDRKAVAVAVARKTLPATKATNNHSSDPPLNLYIPSDFDDNASMSPSKRKEELENKFMYDLLQSSSSVSSYTKKGPSFPNTTTSSIHSHRHSPSLRPLKLEPNSIPILVLYSGDHRLEEYYRECAEWTARFHSDDSSSSSSSSAAAAAPVRHHYLLPNNNNNNMIMDLIYRWYDEMVA